MAYLGMSFDANTVEPADFSALPAGDYTALITASEWKTAKSGDQYLALTLQVVDGHHHGRFLWYNLNIMSSSAKAQDIAQRELSAICRATGKMQISDSAELHDHPVIIKVAYLAAQDDGKGGTWPEKNQIKQWKPAGAAATPVTPAAPAAPKAPPVATAKTAPPVPRAPAKTPPSAPAPTSPVAGKPWMKNQAQAPVAEVAGDFDDDIPF